MEETPRAPRLTWTRQQAGRYMTEGTTGRYEVRSIEYHTEGMKTDRGWHLFHYESDDEMDGYCNTFWTARDAKAAAQALEIGE